MLAVAVVVVYSAILDEGSREITQSLMESPGFWSLVVGDGYGEMLLKIALSRSENGGEPVSVLIKKKF